MSLNAIMYLSSRHLLEFIIFFIFYFIIFYYLPFNYLIVFNFVLCRGTFSCKLFRKTATIKNDDNSFAAVDISAICCKSVVTIFYFAVCHVSIIGR